MKKELLFIFALLCMVAQGAWSEKVVDLSELSIYNNNNTYVAKYGDVLTGSLPKYRSVSIANGATVTLRNVRIQTDFVTTDWKPCLECGNNVTIILEEGSENVIWSYLQPGIKVGTQNTIKIKGSGELKIGVYGSCWYPGIGGDNCGNIVIEGGTITTSGGMVKKIIKELYDWAIDIGAPGIGAAVGGSCGNITISGGTIYATGQTRAAGIGKSYKSSCGTITIYGNADVHAYGGEYGAGIGGGMMADGCTVRIEGGKVYACGGEGGAGIGGGDDADFKTGGSGGDILISGGDVEAHGGDYAAGIGAGDWGESGGTITINGGTVKAYGGKDAAGIGGGESSDDDDQGNSGNIVINGGDVYACGKGWGVGIGAGEDGDVESITINGGTIVAEGGDDIHRAVGGEDDEDFYDNHLSLGSGIMAYITYPAPLGDVVLQWNVRQSQMKDYGILKFKPCDHAVPDLQYYKVDDYKHKFFCSWCGAWYEEDHSFDNNNHCVCGYDGPFLSEITLDVSKDMQAMLSDMKDKTVDITFRGRKFIINSEWNTLCLPFSMTAEQISNSPLNNSKIVELDTEKTTQSDGVLTIAYKTATAIEAGKPYMVKWVIDEEAEETHIDDPIFKNVTISTAAPTVVSAAGISFSGAFAPLTLANGDKTKLWLDDDVRLRWASGQDEQVSPTWCYWNLDGQDASTLNAIVVTFDDGSMPIVELMDGMKDFSILSAFGEQEVNASMEGRELSAVQQADGTWQNRAYTLCLPFYAELFDTGCDFTIYSKAEVTEDGELLFTQEMLPFLYPGNAYLIVVNEGTLRLQEEGVTLVAEADEADEWENAVPFNYVDEQTAGYWLGSLKTIGHDEAVSRKAFTLASDGSFQRITDEHPTWKWPAFRATFCATDLMTADKLTTKYQLDANGEEEEDRSLPAPDGYQGDNDGEATGIAPVIHTIDLDGTERWFDLNGRQLSGKPAQKGVYIHRGKKQVVK